MFFTTACTLLLFVSSTSASIPHSDLLSKSFSLTKGQHQVNHLRHATSISNLPDAFGKQRSTLLSRVVVPKQNIWHAIDDFTLQVFGKPYLLDWYIADIATDGDPTAATLNGAFSCIDMGKSNADPISWWVANKLERNVNFTSKVGGFKRMDASSAPGSRSDFTRRCLNGRVYQKGRRLCENRNDHL